MLSVILPQILQCLGCVVAISGFMNSSVFAGLEDIVDFLTEPYHHSLPITERTVPQYNEEVNYGLGIERSPFYGDFCGKFTLPLPYHDQFLTYSVTIDIPITPPIRAILQERHGDLIPAVGGKYRVTFVPNWIFYARREESANLVSLKVHHEWFRPGVGEAPILGQDVEQGADSFIKVWRFKASMRSSIEGLGLMAWDDGPYLASAHTPNLNVDYRDMENYVLSPSFEIAATLTHCERGPTVFQDRDFVKELRGFLSIAVREENLDPTQQKAGVTDIHILHSEDFPPSFHSNPRNINFLEFLTHIWGHLSPESQEALRLFDVSTPVSGEEALRSSLQGALGFNEFAQPTLTLSRDYPLEPWVGQEIIFNDFDIGATLVEVHKDRGFTHLLLSSVPLEPSKRISFHLQPYSGDRVTGPVRWSDGNWTDGRHLRQSILFTPKTPGNQALYQPPHWLIFSRGGNYIGGRRITGQPREAGSFLHIDYEGEPFIEQVEEARTAPFVGRLYPQEGQPFQILVSKYNPAEPTPLPGMRFISANGEVNRTIVEAHPEGEELRLILEGPSYPFDTLEGAMYPQSEINLGPVDYTAGGWQHGVATINGASVAFVPNTPENREYYSGADPSISLHTGEIRRVSGFREEGAFLHLTLGD